METARLDGWKAIARFLGRDRSTVIRWANARGLPVHSLPGGKSRTVYAHRAELEAWMRGAQSDCDEALVADTKPDCDEALDADAGPDLPETAPYETPVQEPTLAIAAPPVVVGTGKTARWWVIVALLGAAALLLVGTRWYDAVVPVRAPALDAVAQAQLLQARDDIASRSEPRLNAAIAVLRQMRQRHSDQPEVHAALAEAYLLAREFGSLPDGLAFERAHVEADEALARDPRQATALRVLGVISYWRDRDLSAAGDYFGRAIAAAPEDALARQWYANILTDNGQHAAALQEFGVARQLNPGAPHLLADYAWGLWSAGREKEAKALLEDLARRYPALASVHDCLSVMALSAGDLNEYARHLRLRASVRNAPELVGYADLVDEALPRDTAALYRVMMARAIAQAEGSSASDHSWAAFIASTFSDRARLLQILRRAGERDEHWGASGYTSRIARRWSTDAEVLRALAALRQGRIAVVSTTLRRFDT